MKIVYLDAYPLGEASLAPIERWGELIRYEDSSPEQVVERAREAEVVIVNKVKIFRPEIDALPRLRLICVSATGVNNVDTEYAAARGIAVKNVAGYSTQSVAEATLGMALALLRNLVYYDRYVKEGAYTVSGRIFNPRGVISEINGKTWGIIGLGAIGRRVAALAEAFGASVMYHSVSGHRREEHYPEKPLDELLAASDIVSIHAPLTDRTQNLIGDRELHRMKPTAILVNVARGGIVDEAALARAIDQRVIAGAALDVFEHEPMPAGNPLLAVRDPDRLLLAPHSAWNSAEARTELILRVAQNIREFVGGGM
ncbi:MAG: D-2-hydroxyacid dehydrogenase [Rikenellaceae bacterium]|jgi:glycerate dehydrogenase|nr:D-2-hydroxyacid dehydrogenase [Rikenellaceae bacterium]